MAKVPLTELEVITRWSLAVRQPTAERRELIEVLRSDLDYLESLAPQPRAEAPRKQASPRRRAGSSNG